MPVLGVFVEASKAYAFGMTGTGVALVAQGVRQCSGAGRMMESNINPDCIQRVRGVGEGQPPGVTVSRGNRCCPSARALQPVCIR
mmetsp:Transcript_72059/g.120562  ORF Transcript_72059/g.120562 Transcript_72059/m.120562 type:complete len:85 (+) Transcript_72059:434-688(+)